MSEEGNVGDQDSKKPLSLKSVGRLELKKGAELGQVRQSFSHGRSRAVTVEVRKKRRLKPAQKAGEAGAKARSLQPAPAPAPPETAPPTALESQAETVEQVTAAPKSRVVLRTLTEDEKAHRARAVGDAMKAEREARRVAEGEAARQAEEESRFSKEREEASRRAADEEARKKSEEEDRRRAEEDASRRLAVPEESEETAGRRGAATPATPGRPVAPEEEARGRPKRKGDLRRPGAAARRGQPRRQTGKITLSDALHAEHAEERGRSLASLRRQRERERRLAQEALSSDELKPVVREVVVPEAITVQELANRMAVRGVEVIKTLMKLGSPATITQSIEGDTAELVVAEFGHKVKRVSAADVEIGLKGEMDDSETQALRPPVVTVMGHVDHGKTSLLDAMRNTKVAAGEAGGITQHIGAYQVDSPSGSRITFIDTPGHAAFTEMRGRGARVTDIVVLVVAADDGVMPQTVEAINHARAAGVPIIVAINKIDRPDAKPERVRQELLQHEIVTEELGGDVLAVEVSALKKTNLDKLEEAIVLQAELLELKANPERSAEGVVIEARIDRGRGVVCTALLERGTLRIGDILVAGAQWGRVRAMLDDQGRSLDEAGPAMPVEVLGLSGIPEAGDEFVVVENERRAREVTEFRQDRARDARVAGEPRSTVEEMLSAIGEEQQQELPIVVKADVHGSAEAIVGALTNLATEEVAVRILHGAVGAITESDVMLARASNAMIIGFNVRANQQAKELARRDRVNIRYYAVIYDVVDDVKAALEGMLKPTLREQFLGNAQVMQTFEISKIGRIAGCRVTEGLARRGAKVRLLRDNIVIHDGTLKTLKRFKDEVKEVKEGYECGMAFENYHDIRENDVVEFYEIEEIARTLDDTG